MINTYACIEDVYNPGIPDKSSIITVVMRHSTHMQVRFFNFERDFTIPRTSHYYFQRWRVILRDDGGYSMAAI